MQHRWRCADVAGYLARGRRRSPDLVRAPGDARDDDARLPKNIASATEAGERA